jgi:hypothetical protein
LNHRGTEDTEKGVLKNPSPYVLVGRGRVRVLSFLGGKRRTITLPLHLNTWERGYSEVPEYRYMTIGPSISPLRALSVSVVHSF